MATSRLAFHELFCEANPFFDPWAATYALPEDGSEPVEEEEIEIDPETGERKRPTVIPQFPHIEPSLSANARDTAACFDFDANGASTPAGIYPYEWNPDWKKLRDFLYAEGRLSLETALELVKRTRNILLRESNVMTLRPPYVCTSKLRFSSLSF